MLLDGSTTRPRQVLPIGIPIPLDRQRVVSHHSVPSRLDGFSMLKSMCKRLVPPGSSWASSSPSRPESGSPSPTSRRIIAPWSSCPQDQREVKAKHFVAQSLQLRNDICNEPTWEAVFSDQEVNAWLAEDLVTHFADQLPPEVHDPRVLFETDRVILAFQLEKGALQSVITVVARPRVPEENTVELTLEKIRAGILPVPADNILDRIIEHARYRGVERPVEAARTAIPWSS